MHTAYNNLQEKNIHMHTVETEARRESSVITEEILRDDTAVNLMVIDG
jgi:hypothetical protein